MKAGTIFPGGITLEIGLILFVFYRKIIDEGLKKSVQKIYHSFMNAFSF